jgi:hypothetical protein
MRKKSPRNGYALVLSFYSLSQRQMGAMLRMETVRTLQRGRDEGCIQALGRGLDLLETGSPPASPYVCGVTIETSTGPRSFTVTFGQEGFDAEGKPKWSVRAVPTGSSETPQPMPPRFIPATPP